MNVDPVTEASSRPEVVPTTGWGTRDVEEGVQYCWSCAGIRIWYRRKDKTLASGFLYGSAGPSTKDGEEGSDGEEKAPEGLLLPPVDLPLERRVLKSAATRLSILPTHSPMAMLFKLATPVVLLPEASTEVFIQAPVWARIAEVGRPDLPVRDICTIPVEMGWFGSSTAEGEICQFRREAAVLRPEDLVWADHLVVCPVKIRNVSSLSLTLGELYLKVPAFSVFQDERGLWSDDMEIVLAGVGAPSSVKVTGKAPPAAPGATLLTEPREKGGLVKAAFTTTWNALSAATAFGGRS